MAARDEMGITGMEDVREMVAILAMEVRAGRVRAEAVRGIRAIAEKTAGEVATDRITDIKPKPANQVDVARWGGFNTSERSELNTTIFL